MINISYDNNKPWPSVVGIFKSLQPIKPVSGIYKVRVIRHIVFYSLDIWVQWENYIDRHTHSYM